MLKPKNCLGVVTAGAFDWAAAGGAAEIMNSAASVSARNDRTGMDLPSPERSIPYQIWKFGNVGIWKCESGNLKFSRFPHIQISKSLDRRAGAWRTGLGHVRQKRRVELVDRAVGVRSVEVRVADRIERIGDERVARSARALRFAVAGRRRARQYSPRHVEAVALLEERRARRKLRRQERRHAVGRRHAEGHEVG